MTTVQVDYTREQLAAIAAAIGQALVINHLAPPHRQLPRTEWSTLVAALRKTQRAAAAADTTTPTTYHGPANHDERQAFEADIARRVLRERTRRNARARAKRHHLRRNSRNHQNPGLPPRAVDDG